MNEEPFLLRFSCKLQQRLPRLADEADPPASDKDFYWAPEVIIPLPNVHYVQLRTIDSVQDELNAIAKRNGKGALEPNHSSAIDYITFQFVKRGNHCVLQHCASELFVVCCFREQGLVWLSDAKSEAAVVVVDSSLYRRERDVRLEQRDCLRISFLNPRKFRFAACFHSERTQGEEDLAVRQRDRVSVVIRQKSLVTHPFVSILQLIPRCTGVKDERPKERQRKRERDQPDNKDESISSAKLEDKPISVPLVKVEVFDDESSSADEELLVGAKNKGDAFTVYVRRKGLSNFWQDRCIGKRGKRYCCCAPGAQPFTVLGFGPNDDLVSKVLRSASSSSASMIAPNDESGNVLLCYLRAGIPASDSDCRIPLLVSSRAIVPGEEFLVKPSSLQKALFTSEYDWYVATQCNAKDASTLEGSRSLLHGSHNDSVVWRAANKYYYGNREDMAVPAEAAILTFPFTMLSVRSCQRLHGELEVVATHFIPTGTCFLYCGPLLQPSDEESENSSEAQSTAMLVGTNGDRIRGGNISKFVNHHFGFAQHGNVAFRRGSVIYRSGQGGAVKEQHIIFFITTHDTLPGELLLAESYGPEYDSFIERLALCGGMYLSLEERVSQSAIAGMGTFLPEGYQGCYLADIKKGSVVGRRFATSAMSFYEVTLVATDNVIVVREMLGSFPTLERPSAEASPDKQLPMRKTEVVLFIPGWDYKEISTRQSTTIEFLMAWEVLFPRPDHS